MFCTDGHKPSGASDLRFADTVGDGLSDGRELGRDGDTDPATRTNPVAVDTDNDGLSDDIKTAISMERANPKKPTRPKSTRMPTDSPTDSSWGSLATETH